MCATKVSRQSEVGLTDVKFSLAFLSQSVVAVNIFVCFLLIKF